MSVCNPSFERTVLSAIIFEPNKLNEVRQTLSPIDFYLPSHQEIFKGIIKLSDKNYPIDEEFLLREINQKIATGDDIIQIMSANPAADLSIYVSKIKESSLKRELNTLISEIKQSVQDENFSSTKILLDLKNKIQSIEKRGKLNIVDYYDITEVEEKDTEYICKKFLPFPRYQVSLVSAQGGVGKTFTLVRAAIEILKENPDEKVFAWFSEDENGKTKKRANDIAINLADCKMEEFKGRFFISDDMPIDILEENNKKLQPTEDFFKFKNQCKDFTTIILDPLIGFFSMSENDNTYAKRLMLQFVQWAKNESKTIIFIHHSNKDGDRSRGASAIEDAARLIYLAHPDKDSDGKPIKNGFVNFKIQKDNNNVSSVKLFGDNNSVREKIFPSITKYAQPTVTPFEYQTESQKSSSIQRSELKFEMPEPI